MAHTESPPLHPSTLDAIPALLAVLDLQGTIVRVNRAWKRFGDDKGLTLPGHGVGVNYLQLCEASSSADGAAAARGIRQVLNGEIQEYLQVYPCPTPQGEGWFQLRVSRSGPAPYILVMHEDVTERTQAEIAWRRQAEFTRSLLESSPDCVKVVGLQGELLWMSEGGQRLMEVDDFRQIRGTSWTRFWPPEAQPQVERVLDAGRRGEVGRFQTDGPTARGTAKFWDVVVTPLRGTDGQPVQLLATSRDVTALRQAQHEASKQAEKTRRVLTGIQEAFYTLDEEWRFTYLNPRAEEYLQRTALEVLGRTLLEAFPEAARTELHEQYGRAMRERCNVQFEMFYPPLKSWFRIGAYPHDEGLTVFFQDINAARLEEHAQQDRNAILEMTIQQRPLPEILARITGMVEQQFPHYSCAVLLLDQGRLCAAAPGLAPELAGVLQSLDVREGHGPCSTAVVRGEAVVVDDVASHPSCAAVRGALLSVGLRACIALPIMDGEQTTLATLSLFARTAGPFPAQVLQALEKARHLAAVSVEHHRLTEKLAHQALYDALTGLPNRRLFEEQLGRVMAGASAEAVALLFIDVDDFKTVNDHLGHLAGDQILVEIAGRLRRTVHKDDLLARISGDEFTVILSGVSEADAVLVAQRILQTFEAPFVVEACELYVTASIGLSLTPTGGQEASALKRSADLAMYHAKSHKTGVAVFRKEMNRRASERFQLATHLRRAAELDQLQLHYQPQVQLDDGAVVGAEALLRWHHPQLGAVSPAHFIPVAEETGLIVPIGEWVLRQACRQGAAWQRAGHPPIRIAVNVSALEFEGDGFVETVTACLRDTGFPAQWLELELTERVVMRNVEESVRRMHLLRALGVCISVDDFGTGYSSLSYLPRLPINILKIDRSFVSGLNPTSANLPVVQAILSLATSLRLETIAEGIETEAERRILRTLGCTLGQGYLFAPPRPAEQLYGA